MVTSVAVTPHYSVMFFLIRIPIHHSSVNGNLKDVAIDYRKTCSSSFYT